ncbi:MAG: SRPBCC domain-containing protein [Acidimicrobiia bacterium]
MREIRTVVDIDAPPQDVWNVLMDFAKYGEWNPFVRSLDGTPAVGEQLVAMLGATGKKPMKVSPIVQEYDAPTRFAWLGSMGFKGVFDGRHQFDLVATETGTRFHHYEEFSGILAPLVIAAIRKSTTRGFEEMNQALKLRVESGS